MNDIGLLLANKDEYIVEDFGIVPPILIKDFIQMGEDYEKFYENIILPWRLGWRSFYTETQYNEFISSYSGISDFDMLFINFENSKRMSIQTEYGEKELVILLKESIDFIFKCDCEIDFEIGYFKLNDDQFITRLNYEQICDIILKTNACEKSKVDEPPVFENDRQKDIYHKLENKRRRDSEKNKLNVKKLLNIVMVYTKYQINYIIKDMTMYQLFNTYSSFNLEDSYKLNLTWVPVASDMSKLDLEHWSSKIK